MVRSLPIVIVFVIALSVLAAMPLTASTQVWRLDVEAGKWYAFRRNGWNGASAYHATYGHLTVYVWDLNSSYFIFHSPASGTVYIFQQQVSNSVLSTQSWFISGTSMSWTVNCTACVVQAGQTRGCATASQSSAGSVVARFNGTHVITDPVLSYSRSPSPLTVNYELLNISSYWAVARVTLSFSLAKPSYATNRILSHSISFTKTRVTIGSTTYDPGFPRFWSDLKHYWTNPSSWSTSVTVSSSSVSYTFSPSGTTDYVITSSRSGTVTFVGLSASLTVSLVLAAVSGNTLTAPVNNNVIVLSTPTQASAPVSITTASIISIGTRLNLNVSTKDWVLISLQSPVSGSSVNPVLITDKPMTGFYCIENNVYHMLFKVGGNWSGVAWIAWTFPKSIAESVRYELTQNPITSYITVLSGQFYISGGAYVFTNASVAFFNYHKLIRFLITGTYQLHNATTVSVPNSTYIFTKPGTIIQGTLFSIGETATDITPPVPLTVNRSVTANYTVVAAQETVRIPVNLLTHLYSASGTWGYRVPVYMSFGASPQGLPVFRLELPLGSWVRQGILSSGLEDLLIVDWENKPVYFYVSHWESLDTAVVYVRLNKPPPGSTFSVYVLLMNRQLWGSGTTYTSIATFDFVSPQLPFTTYGLYNTISLRPIPRWVRFYTTMSDHVTYYMNGTLVECHGSFCVKHALPPVTGGQEMVVRVSDSRASLFVDGDPLFTLDISMLTYYRNLSLTTIHFVEYGATEFSAHYHSVPYTYSLGYLQGGLYYPPEYRSTPTSTPPPAATGGRTSFGVLLEMMPLLLVLVVIGMVVKWLNTGVERPRGGWGVNLP